MLISPQRVLQLCPEASRKWGFFIAKNGEGQVKREEVMAIIAVWLVAVTIVALVITAWVGA